MGTALTSKNQPLLVPEHGKEAWFGYARCPPITAELWRIDLSTPQNFSPRDCIRNNKQG
jgi:hypothetical protein